MNAFERIMKRQRDLASSAAASATTTTTAARRRRTTEQQPVVVDDPDPSADAAFVLDEPRVVVAFAALLHAVAKETQHAAVMRCTTTDDDAALAIAYRDALGTLRMDARVSAFAFARCQSVVEFALSLDDCTRLVHAVKRCAPSSSVQLAFVFYAADRLECRVGAAETLLCRGVDVDRLSHPAAADDATTAPVRHWWSPSTVDALVAHCKHEDADRLVRADNDAIRVYQMSALSARPPQLVHTLQAAVGDADTAEYVRVYFIQKALSMCRSLGNAAAAMLRIGDNWRIRCDISPSMFVEFCIHAASEDTNAIAVAAVKAAADDDDDDDAAE